MWILCHVIKMNDNIMVKGQQANQSARSMEEKEELHSSGNVCITSH
jgi:hypothetical protein